MPTRATSLSESAVGDSAPRRRSLIAAGSAHAVHDGLSALIYILLPIWQTQFAISYAMIGFQLLAGVAGGLPTLLLALMLGGLGASTQHPLASSLVTDVYADGGGVNKHCLNIIFPATSAKP